MTDSPDAIASSMPFRLNVTKMFSNRIWSKHMRKACLSAGHVSADARWSRPRSVASVCVAPRLILTAPYVCGRRRRL